MSTVFCGKTVNHSISQPIKDAQNVLLAVLPPGLIESGCVVGVTWVWQRHRIMHLLRGDTKAHLFHSHRYSPVFFARRASRS